MDELKHFKCGGRDMMMEPIPIKTKNGDEFSGMYVCPACGELADIDDTKEKLKQKGITDDL